MRVQLVPREQTEQSWREWGQEKTRSRQDSAKPSVVMADEAAALLDRREFMFRGRPYRVPPVPWPLAAQLVQAQDRLLGLPRATGAKAVIRELLIVARLCKLLCHPAGRVRRLLWPITRNPFLQASPREVGELLGFFSACHIMDAVASPSPTTPRRGTSSPSSPGSSGATRSGPGRTATRSLGAIS